MSSKRRRGHNLLEVVIAAVIFCTVMIFLVGVWSLYHHALHKSRNRLGASALARLVMEEQLSKGYQGIATGTPSASGNVTSETSIRGRYIKVRYDWEFHAVDVGLGNDFRRLTSAVYWTDDGGQQSMLYETYLFRNT